MQTNNVIDLTSYFTVKQFLYKFEHMKLGDRFHVRDWNFKDCLVACRIANKNNSGKKRFAVWNMAIDRDDHPVHTCWRID